MGTVIRHLQCFAVAVIACVVIALGALSVSTTMAVFTPAQAQVSAEFQSALEPYGSWQPHPRFGEVWVPYDLPPGWRPYTYGRWVYTEEWGWYWVSDEEEADWGWVTFHYGRWAHDRRIGWFWVPGEEWGPAWVDWRRGDDYVGWAPLPPDEVVYESGNDPAYWIFLPPRYLVAPRVRTYFLPPQRTIVVFRRTVIVNRTVRLEHRDHRGRFAVNPGIAPGIVAAAGRRPVQTYRVQPRVLASTQGVAGAVQVRPQDLSRPGQGQRHQRGQPRPGGPSQLQATVQPTQAVVQPVARVPQPQALRNDERGRLGPTPPRAAQGATVAPPPPPKSSPASQPNGVPRGPTPPTGPTVQTPRPAPPATAQPPAAPPLATAPSVTTPPQQLERRDASPPRGPAGPPPQQPTIVRPIPPQGTPPSSPPPQPQQQLRGPPPPSGGPPPQPTIVRPIAPQSAPPSSPPPPQQQLRGPPPQPQQQMQPPPQPRQVQPPPQPPPQPRQVQPPPQVPRQVQPPPQQRPVQPPPTVQPQQQKRPPPPKPGEKPAEQPR
jgi:hypothetical protein